MRFFKKYYLAIALFSLRISAIWSVMLIYSLFQVILLYFQVSFSFLPLNVVECAGLSAENVVSSERTSQPNIIKKEVSGMLNSDKISQKYQDSKPDWNTNLDIQDTNIQETINPTLETSYSINAPLEGFDNLSMMTLGIITMNFFVILGLLLIFINYLISYAKLESKKFVTDRPLLQKFLKASEKSRNFITKFVFLFIVFGTCSMFYFLCYLLYFLKDLGL